MSNLSFHLARSAGRALIACAVVCGSNGNFAAAQSPAYVAQLPACRTQSPASRTQSPARFDVPAPRRTALYRGSIYDDGAYGRMAMLQPSPWPEPKNETSSETETSSRRRVARNDTSDGPQLIAPNTGLDATEKTPAVKEVVQKPAPVEEIPAAEMPVEMALPEPVSADRDNVTNRSTAGGEKPVARLRGKFPKRRATTYGDKTGDIIATDESKADSNGQNSSRRTPAADSPFGPALLPPKEAEEYELPAPAGETSDTAEEILPNEDELPAPGEDLPAPQGEHHYEPLPSLDEEIWLHGGSYLYAPEGDRLNWPEHDPHAHVQVLRLPEDWHAPQPVTMFDNFLGAGPIPHHPNHRWPKCGYHWDPRLVLYGAYELIGTAFEADDERHDLLGHQLLLDLDFRVTDTDRLHVHWRPLGENNTGGSFYRLNDPEGYDDNSTGIPQRYWVEFEVASVFGGFIHDQFKARDYHVVLGKVPFAAHNRLLINDEILGFIVSKNTIFLGNLSNLNIQAVVALDDVDAYTDSSANLYMLHANADYYHTLWELTYGYVQHGNQSDLDAQYLAASATKLCGPHTFAGRAMFRMASEAAGGGGQLFVLEYNRHWLHTHGFCGVEKSVFYATAFRSTNGWQSISGGNFDRVRTAFAVDPLIPLAAARAPSDNVGMAIGWQLFRHHEDESLLPELAYDAPGGDSVWGVGLRYQRKTGPRSFFEVQGVGNFSNNPALRREGVFLSETFLF